MKFSSQTLRTFTTLHTWVGLVAGFGLFVAFYAGALTLFHHDLPLWQTRAQPRRCRPAWMTRSTCWKTCWRPIRKRAATWA